MCRIIARWLGKELQTHHGSSASFIFYFVDDRGLVVYNSG